MGANQIFNAEAQRRRAFIFSLCGSLRLAPLR